MAFLPSQVDLNGTAPTLVWPDQGSNWRTTTLESNIHYLQELSKLYGLEDSEAKIVKVPTWSWTNYSPEMPMLWQPCLFLDLDKIRTFRVGTSKTSLLLLLSLLQINPVVSEEMVKMWNVKGNNKDGWKQGGGHSLWSCDPYGQIF